MAARDGFNWGYDPWHYTVPEGSYARGERILEFRAMVAALARAGLRVVMDVVYNHTHAHGEQPPRGARPDRPRLLPPAARRRPCRELHLLLEHRHEHAMMEKLMLDSLRTWRREYKLDGFRFDLMGFHSRETMLRVRAALGEDVLLYGEGWEFGEIAGDARFVAATQRNLAGTSVLTLRRRPARGGAPQRLRRRDPARAARAARSATSRPTTTRRCGTSSPSGCRAARRSPSACARTASR